MNLPKVPYHLGILFITLIGILYLFGGRIRTELIHDPRPRLLSYFTVVPPGFLRVLDIVSGDTITLQIDGHERDIRLAGIVATACPGYVSDSALRSLLSKRAVRIQIERDGRYTIFLVDGTNVNTLLVFNGQAKADTTIPDALRSRFMLLEHDAQMKKRGVWALCQ